MKRVPTNVLLTCIEGAKAPTLIQYGDADQRVPVSDALENLDGFDKHLFAAPSAK